MATKTVTVIITQPKGSTELNWAYSVGGNDVQVIDKATQGEIDFVLDDQTGLGLKFCAKPMVSANPDGQIVNRAFTSTDVTVTDVHSVTQVTAGMYLYVQDSNGNIYQSPDPEVENTGSDVVP